jgi:hypothetical protein
MDLPPKAPAIYKLKEEVSKRKKVVMMWQFYVRELSLGTSVHWFF